MLRRKENGQTQGDAARKWASSLREMVGRLLVLAFVFSERRGGRQTQFDHSEHDGSQSGTPLPKLCVVSYPCRPGKLLRTHVQCGRRRSASSLLTATNRRSAFEHHLM